MNESAAAPRNRWALVKTVGRWLLFAAGLVAAAGLVVDAGPMAVWNTLIHAGAWLPLVMLGEFGFATMDVLSLRALYGARARSVPLSVWLRSGIMAYGVMVLLPAGRAGGEVMRAASLAPYIGGPRAAAGAALFQGISLWGNTLISIPCYCAVAWHGGAFSPLALFVAGNAIATGVVGAIILFGARYASLGGWLGRRIKALSAHGSRFDDHLKEMPALPVVPIFATLGGRVFQTIQYGLILCAVGGSLTIGSALVAQAIHLVGAGLGDMVPNQVGITESAYRAFAGALNLGNAPALAISIALVHRVCQFTLAGSSLLVGALWRPDANHDASAPTAQRHA